MNKTAILKIVTDKFNKVWIASLKISEKNVSLNLETQSSELPINLQDLEDYYTLGLINLSSSGLRSQEDFEVDRENIVQGSTFIGEEARSQYLKYLKEEMKSALRSTDVAWQSIRETLAAELKTTKDLEIIIQCNSKLWKLPWHEWDLLEEYPDAGISYCLESYAKPSLIFNTENKGKVRILLILGDDKNIDLSADKTYLNKLKAKGAEIFCLSQPSAYDFIEAVSDRKGWDIFFFAGHSTTQNDIGKIYLREEEFVEIEDFKNTLKSAINRGLKIAIFNSCQGVGLATAIANLNLAVVMFMHEKVTDEVAHCWLESFLSDYSSGKPLHTAFRHAQIELEKFNKKLLGATLLPKLYRNLSQEAPSWKQLRYKTNKITERPRFNKVFLSSFIVTSLVVGVRSLGWLQPWELKTLDSYTRLQPKVEPDSRILIITVTQKDINSQTQKSKSSLPDEELNLLLSKLQVHKPLAIGLDIVRDFPVEPKYKYLYEQLTKNSRLIAICDRESSTVDAILPPPEVPPGRLGFTDLHEAELVRRSILIQNATTSCPTGSSLSLQLAKLYLAHQNIQPRYPESYLKLDRVVFKPIQSPWGGYQKEAPQDKGHQILLKYRPSHPVAQTVTLSDVLNNQVSPSFIQNKIVLIGVDAPSGSDLHPTPYGQITGVALHAHMVSQILSSVLDNQPLVWVLPQWGEVLLIISLSMGGSLIIFVLGYRSPLQLRSITGLLIVGIYGFCLIFFLQRGGWLPFLPPVIALVITTEILIFKNAKLCD